ncbi:MAG: RpiB/LacA/LacB family sugar-phosphate isomerase [Acidimicrobiales bacterium]
MRIAFGADEETCLTDTLCRSITESGHICDWRARGQEWPEVGREVALAVASGEVEFGVVCCWTGTGVSMAANKVTGIRAALCSDATTAEGARRWNDANVLALSIRLTSPEIGREILKAFLSTGPDEAETERISRV